MPTLWRGLFLCGVRVSGDTFGANRFSSALFYFTYMGLEKKLCQKHPNTDFSGITNQSLSELSNNRIGLLANLMQISRRKVLDNMIHSFVKKHEEEIKYRIEKRVQEIEKLL